ncbi:hypothetical protein PR048_033165 [Dryococelus australis]|uniref:Uncharacterized protein n=1 Tax=Dryococelus australis TaxID=614101 RepID=A0ABQ9FZG6_9NEOP|nr:hypothetical protein PR048_033165 [Dryococelus australis]
MQGWRKPERTHRPTALSGTISSCGNLGVTWPGIEPGSRRLEASTIYGAAVAEWSACSPPTMANQFDPRTGRVTPGFSYAGIVLYDVAGLRLSVDSLQHLAGKLVSPWFIFRCRLLQNLHLIDSRSWLMQFPGSPANEFLGLWENACLMFTMRLWRHAFSLRLCLSEHYPWPESCVLVDSPRFSHIGNVVDVDGFLPAAPSLPRSSLTGGQRLNIKQRLKPLNSLFCHANLTVVYWQFMRASVGNMGKAPECKGGGNLRSPTKLADQLHCPAQLPHANIQEQSHQEFNVVRLDGKLRSGAGRYKVNLGKMGLDQGRQHQVYVTVEEIRLFNTCSSVDCVQSPSRKMTYVRARKMLLKGREAKVGNRGNRTFTEIAHERNEQVAQHSTTAAGNSKDRCKSIISVLILKKKKGMGWLDYSPLTKCKPGSIPGDVAPVFSHVGIMLDDTAGRDLLFPHPLHYGAAPYSPRFTVICSQDFTVMSCPIVFSQSIVPITLSAGAELGPWRVAVPAALEPRVGESQWYFTSLTDVGDHWVKSAGGFDRRLK